MFLIEFVKMKQMKRLYGEFTDKYPQWNGQPVANRITSGRKQFLATDWPYFVHILHVIIFFNSVRNAAE